MKTKTKRERESLDLAISLTLPSHDDDDQVFECKTCGRKFSSFQALGGHRASHKKPKLGTEEKEDDEEKANLVRLGNHNNKVIIMRMHECSVCGREFSVGQALGGHMRKHRGRGAAMTKSFPSLINDDDDDKVEPQVVAKLPLLKTSNIMCLDLNFTPLQNDFKLLFGNKAPQLNLSLCCT